MRVSFVPPNLDGPRHVKVRDVQHISGDDWLVSFKGVKDRTQAEALVGKLCLVDTDELPEDYEDALYIDDVAGYAVVDENLGSIGTLTEVLDMPGQSLLSVDRDGREVLIPAVDEFILDIDDEAETILVSIPSGLLNLDSLEAVDEQGEDN